MYIIKYIYCIWYKISLFRQVEAFPKKKTVVLLQSNSVFKTEGLLPLVLRPKSQTFNCLIFKGLMVYIVGTKVTVSIALRVDMGGLLMSGPTVGILAGYTSKSNCKFDSLLLVSVSNLKFTFIMSRIRDLSLRPSFLERFKLKIKTFLFLILRN